MCGRYHFSAELLDEIRDITEQKDWKLELGVLDRDIHPGDTAPVIVAALEEASNVPAPAKNAGAASYAGRGGSLRVCRQKWGYAMSVSMGWWLRIILKGNSRKYKE